tara:strand:- start:1667 stop:2854 length:1188 start_codon:yes stop_codon:yes gene_type:complete
MKDLLKRLDAHYPEVREPKLPFRRFKHETVLSLIDTLKNNEFFKIEEIARSIEGRPIQSITIGSGNIRILVWTQMHGNESTATRAVFDFLNFCNSELLTADYSEWFNQVCMCFVPVLNPDGLERYQRRNALNIDPNRDAARRSTPEIRALFSLLESFKPDWCFNMHDQRNLFNVGGTKEPATLSFLSPSTADGKRNQNQSDAMMMIDKLNQALQDFIPNKIGRFTHEFYPTASGDNIQSLGYRTILVESGGHVKDVEREVARKMNFMLLWKAIELTASGNWSKGTALRYSEIPKNDQKLFDLLIRNVGIERNNQVVFADIGIDRVEIPASLPEGFVVKSSIREIGDLSHYYGYDEVSADGAVVNVELNLNEVADFTLKNNNETFMKVVNGFVVHG